MIRRFVAPSLLVLTAAAPAAAQHWPAWRGPTGNGVAAADAAPPLTWSETTNVRWKVALPGLGASTPVVWGDRVFVTSAVRTETGDGESGAGDEDGGAGHHEYVVLAFARSSGKELWRTVVAAGVPHEKGHHTATHASASITTDGERLHAFFGSAGLFCLDLDGEVLWSKDLGQQATLRGFGEGASPVLHGGLLVVPWDHEGPSFVVALDARTGEERWRRPRATDSSWGTPLVTRAGGREQVILTGSGVTHAYDLATGKPLWSCGGMSANPVAGATVAAGIAYVMNSYEGNVVQAIRLAGASGDLTGGEHLLWTHARNASYVPCPLVYDGLLYFLRDSVGVLSCLDAATGKVRYEGKRLALRRVHASPICAAGRLYIASREGATVVVKAGASFGILAMNRLDDVLDATPVAVGSELLLRGQRHLYCIAEAKPR